MRLLRDLRCWLFYAILTRPVKGLRVVGSECPWTLLTSQLNSGSRIISAGAGNDISFEKELCDTCGSSLILLDPSPTGAATWSREALFLPKVTFLPAALGKDNGLLGIAEPVDKIEGSFRSSTLPGENLLQVPCRNLESLMKEKGWDYLDLLKMDIEGAEFEVLKSILEQKIFVKQICVEFHHGGNFATTGKDTINALMGLTYAGYRLVHRIHWDHTFVHKSCL